MTRPLRTGIHGWYPSFKRAFDVAAAGVLLVSSAPLLGLIALLIWLDDGRPVLFRQTRAGREGHPFTVYKFRTLHTGHHDPRRPGEAVTRTGRFLRRWGLDELPQLWNVLRGDMSLVGPRPTLPEQVACYGPFERQRLAVRPGLTGWAQIHGRNALSWPERIRLDVWYVEHLGPGLDLRILVRTLPALLSGHGIYGDAGENDDFRASDMPATAPSPPPS
ncbi:MAG: hypothetical protein KatS3mg044_0939 [Rhodothermaceae bacterium]|nr:MAG: hypothetical protein KatS3mg044_0939 [Rhodothermaceae bacterium]